MWSFETFFLYFEEFKIYLYFKQSFLQNKLTSSKPKTCLAALFVKLPNNMFQNAINHTFSRSPHCDQLMTSLNPSKEKKVLGDLVIRDD